MIWDSITVDEIKAKKKYSLVGGPFGSDLSGIHYVEFGVPVIRGTNLPFNQKFSSEDFVYVSEEKANKLSSNTAHAGDLIFTQRGTLGQVGIVPEAEFERYIISQSQMKLTIDISKADPLYVYYYFRTKECNYRIENLALSSGVPHINLGILKKFKIPYPPLPIQRKIASILSAYDELIENNTQRIKLLEEMSEEIYKEWFVRLRFPGYESTNFFDADCNEVAHDTLGALPEDWEKIKLRNCFSKYIGGGWGEETPKGKNSEPAYVIRGTDIPNARIGNLNFDVLRYHTESNLSSRLLKKNDIIFEVSGGTESQSLGRTVLMSQSLIDKFDHGVICASFCKSIRVKEDYISAVYIYLLLNRLYVTGEIMLFQVQSTGISNYKFEDFIERQKILIPKMEVQVAFDKIVKPMLDEIQILGSKNQLLQQTRDLLLPRLISGKLSIEHLLAEEENLAIAAEPEYAYGKD